MKVSADRSRFGKGALNSSADRCRSPRYKNAKVVKDERVRKGLMKDSADRSRGPPAIATIRVSLAAAVCREDVPVELRNYQDIEANGLSSVALASCQRWMASLHCTQDWMGYGYKGCRQGTLTFFVHLAYSVLTVSTLRRHGMELSEHTVCI